MKKAFAIAAFALVSLAATSAHAQSTISPVPGAPDRPHETSPTVDANDQISGPRRSADQQMAGTRSRYKTKRMSGALSPADRKEDRKEMKMRRKADKAGNM
jgi:hypothetical protein